MKTQGILFAQVVNSLIVKIQNIPIIAARFTNVSKSVLHKKLSQISEIGTGNIFS